MSNGMASSPIGTVSKVSGWILAVIVGSVVIGVPIAHYRTAYVQHKRLRVVAEGRVYRSGQMTAEGFRDACRRYHIKTVINLQDDEPHTEINERDPALPASPLDSSRSRQSEVLESEGARLIQLDGNALDSTGADGRPKLVDDFLAIMDDESNYPVLLHCKAGLHRTGLMTAVYRMEYEGRSRTAALEELKANGFGDFKATDANDYVKTYIFDFQPHLRATDYKWPATPARGTTWNGRPSE